MNIDWTIKPLYLACMLALSTSASAEIFSLGEVLVTAPAPNTASDITSTVDQNETRAFNRETVGSALNALPGITTTEGGGRNEQMMSLRGFDLRQVPVFVDGIPVYVSYDGYVDLGRFNTFDLAAINMSKGFSSVLYGPNALGGAINLVSRKPSKELEGDVTAGLYLNKGLGANGFHTDLNAGGNRGTWYWQASGSYLNKDQYQVSGDFQPTKEALADHRPDYLASGREWRTPPFWGIGLAQKVEPRAGFLHDGRARTLLEAVLWHDGEAAKAAQAVKNMSAPDRQALVDFLESL